MKFVSSRELRLHPSEVWRQLQREKDLVITVNGKPRGVLTATDEGNLEEVLATLRQQRALAAVAHLRQVAVSHSLDRIPDDRIERIIRTTRRRTRRASTRAAH